MADAAAIGAISHSLVTVGPIVSPSTPRRATFRVVVKQASLVVHAELNAVADAAIWIGERILDLHGKLARVTGASGRLHDGNGRSVEALHAELARQGKGTGEPHSRVQGEIRALHKVLGHAAGAAHGDGRAARHRHRDCRKVGKARAKGVVARRQAQVKASDVDRRGGGVSAIEGAAVPRHIVHVGWAAGRRKLIRRPAQNQGCH